MKEIQYQMRQSIGIVVTALSLSLRPSYITQQIKLSPPIKETKLQKCK